MATWLHKRGHRNCTGHLAACTWCSVQERYCAGRLAQGKDGGGEGVPYNSYAPPSHSISSGDGVLTTYNSAAGPEDEREYWEKMTLDNSARRRGSNLFCSAPPSPPGAPYVCVGKGRNDPQRGGICGTTCVVPPHHLDCACVRWCVVVFTLFFFGLAMLFWVS